MATTTAQTCSAQGCRRQARLMAVDTLPPLLQRRQIPACARHALLWYRQDRGTVWVFPQGEDEAVL